MDYMGFTKRYELLSEAGQRAFLGILSLSPAPKNVLENYESGLKLAQVIWELAPEKKNRQRRAHMRKKVVREGFQTVEEAIAFLRKEYGEGKKA